MKKVVFFVASSILLMFGNAALAQVSNQAANTKTVLIDKVTPASGSINIGYEKYRLPNGLTLIIHEDHSDPIVHVEVTYHVGSARETPGKSGFAHFFEHMMFQGSKNIKDEEHFKIVEGAGGNMNGSTTQDRTNYFETLPSNYLETALWLEADRMGFLLDSVTQKKFEVQRSTVKNEKGQNVDNIPYGRTGEVKDQTLYPTNHPYSWPTIGYLEDLDRVNVEDLKNFFMRWYGPNNACVVVAGDVNVQDVIRLTEKYFGPIPAGPEVRAQRVDPVRLPDNKYANFGDNIYLPLYYIVYPTVANYHPDEPALDLLASVIGNGNNSIMYKKFIKTEKAVQAAAGHPCSELSGEFSFQILPYPDNDVDIETMFKQTLEEFEKNGISDDDLARAKGQIETQFTLGLQSVASRSTQLSMWWYLGHKNIKLEKNYNVSDELARYQKLTKEDLMRVFRQYIKGKNYVMVNVFPKRANAAVNKEETVVNTTSGVTKSELDYKGLTYTAPTDNFDRSKRPDAGSSKPPVIPNFYTASWDNGIKLIGTEYKETPVVSILLSMDGGNLAVGDVKKSGLAVLTSRLMGEGSQNYTAEQIDNELEKLGSTISFAATADKNIVQLTCLKKNLDATLKLLEEKLMRPKFTQEDFKLHQSQIYQGINAQKTSASAAADLAFAKIIYGKSIAAEPTTGTLNSIKSLSLKDANAYYEKFYGPDFATLTIVGEVSEQEILPKLEFLKKWNKKNIVIPTLPVAPENTNSNKQIMLVDKYKAAQSEIRIGNIGMPYDWNGKFFRANAANFPLGGNFNSRLNLNLREENGFTYGIYSYFSGYKNRSGVFAIGTGVRSSATDSALKEIMKEVNGYVANGINDDEVTFMKNSITQSDALRYETTFQKAGFLNRLVEYNLPKDYIKQQNDLIKAMTKDDLNKIIKEVFQPEKMAIIIVGDKDKIKGQLEKSGFKVIDYKEVEVITPNSR